MADYRKQLNELNQLSGELDLGPKEKAYNDKLLELLGSIINELELSFEEDLEDFYVCPNCNEKIIIESHVLDSEEYIICPKCREPMGIFTQDIEC